MYKKNIRFINTFRDLDLLESVYPYCQDCGYTGYRLMESRSGALDQLDDLIVDRIHKRYCIKCKSRKVGLRVESNEYMKGISQKYLFSDNLCGMFRVKPVDCWLSFRKMLLY